MAKRHDNKGLRKLCTHPRRQWAKCEHPWHFNYKPSDPARRNSHSKDGGYRFSLDKHLGRRIDSKTDAETEAERIRLAIKEGRFGQAEPRQEMTLRQLADVYLERYVGVERPATADDFRSGLRVICDTPLPRPAGGTSPFGEWRVADIVTDTIERYREARRGSGTGTGGTNRSLSRLRALYNWAVRVGYVDRTPFKRGTETVVRLSREIARSRRLNADVAEESRLLAACDSHLRAIVEAALETGMRLGEILGLRWQQVEGLQMDGTTVRWASRPEIALLAANTKTKRDRRIPISTRLRGILELRRFDPAGQPHARDAFIFGNALGQRVQSTKRAWMSAVLRANGHTPRYTLTMNLTPELRATLQTINLHFHDLRREAGSRWMDAGVPIATIQRWLGHTNVSQTSTYLAARQRRSTITCGGSRRTRPLCNESQRRTEQRAKRRLDGLSGSCKAALHGGSMVESITATDYHWRFSWANSGRRSDRAGCTALLPPDAAALRVSSSERRGAPRACSPHSVSARYSRNR